MPSDPSLDFESDSFDHHSILLGAFFHHHGSRELAGTLRIIRNCGPGPQSRELSRLLRLHGLPDNREQDSLPCNLPACESFNLTTGQVRLHYPGFGALRSENGIEVSSEICELSRLAILKKYRRHRFGIERKLFELIVIDCSASPPRRNWFVIAVHPSKRAKFERYGFRALDSLGVKPYMGLGQPAVLLALDLQSYLISPNPFMGSLEVDTLLYKVSGSLSWTLEERVRTAELV